MRVFDLDGTLFDTFAATKAAYEKAGMPEFTLEHFRSPNSTWQCSEEIRTKKRELYKDFLFAVKPAWAFEFYRPSEDIVLTGASQDSVQLLRNKFNLPLCCPFGYGLTRASKATILRNLASIGPELIYYDDDPEIEPLLKHIENLTLVLGGQ